MLDEQQRRLVLEQWNATEPAYRLEGDVVSLLEGAAIAHGESLAVAAPDGRITYSQLNARANQVAHWLARHGIGAGSIVAVAMERSVAMITCMAGVLKAGAAYLPLDPTYPADRILFSLQECGSAVVLTQTHLRSLFEGAAVEAVAVDGWDFLAGLPSSNPEIRPQPDDCAYVIYTSGSTGQPKGVMIGHRSLLNLVLWHQHRYQVRAQDRASQIASPGFDACGWEIWPYLAAGSSIFIVEEEVKLLPERLQEWLVRQQITLAFLPTPLAELLLARPWPKGIALRALLVGGDRLTRRPAEGIGFAVINHYGPTEATVVTTAGEVAPRDDTGRLPDIGRPISHYQVYILDSCGEPVPVGVPGELYIGGEGVALGYVCDPDPEHPHFLPNPFHTGRMYRSGDVARYLPDGRIEFIGRTDQQVKVRGYRIELAEIKSLLEQQPDISAAAVDLEQQEGNPASLVAYIVPRAGSHPEPGKLRAALNKRLPHYMLPSAFVLLPSLPLTANGKLDRHKLAGLHKLTPTRSYVEPHTATQKALAAIWSRLLHISPIGLHDNFFDLGGHSLLAGLVVNRIENELGMLVPLAAVFKHCTCEDLAAFLDSHGRKSSPQIKILRSPQSEYRASSAQARLWFLQKLWPDSPAYNLCDTYQLDGAIDPVALQKALHALLRRHESLRTTFIERNGEPVQRVASEATLFLVRHDLRSLQSHEQGARATELIKNEAQRAFDLETGPLFRCLLLRLQDESHVLAITMHHIVSDAWSREIMISEMACLYEEFSGGNSHILPELPIQYGDFAEWQRTRLGGIELNRQVSYWREQLAGAPELLELPTDRPRGAGLNGTAGICRFAVGKSLTEELRKLSRIEGVTLFMTLLAAFQILMARYSGQDDVCVGTPIANRTRQETEGLIGFFANTLVLRGRVGGNTAFAEFLRSTREMALEAYSHQEIPFDQLVSILQPERSLSATPFVQVMFALQNVPQRKAKSGRLTLNPMPIAASTAKFDLSVILEEEQEAVAGEAEFDTALFDHATVARMMDSYVRLLADVVAHPLCAVRQLKMLDEQQRRLVLEQWNATEPAYRLEGDVVSLLEGAAIAHGESLAVAAPDGRITYSQLNARANQVAHWLARHGIGAGSIVAVAMERSVAMITCMAGVLKAGAAYLPLDPTYPADRILFSLQECGSAVVLTQTHLRSLFEGAAVEAVAVDGWDFLAGLPSSNPEIRPQPDDCAYVIYTSGSTGQPKGVMIGHRSLLNLVLWHQHRYQVRAQDRASQIASPGFDACGWEIWPYLAAGSSIFIVEEEVKLLPERLQEWLVRQQITLAFLPTPLAELLLARPWPKGIALRALLVGGDRLTRRPAEGIGFAVINHYGPTEATVVTTAGEVAPRDDTGRLPDIGRPISHYQVYILDSCGEPVPVGVPGELYIGGEGVALGYVCDPDPEHPHFLPNPFHTGRMYRSGDVARYLPDGRIEFIGRTDQQVKVRGYRIELAEIKSLLEQQPDISAAAVDLEQQEGNPASLVAYIVPRAGSHPEPGKLRAALNKRLPHYMLPSAFVLLPSLPLTANGKLDRHKLAGLHKLTPTRSYVEPHTATQKALAAIWSRLLHISPIGLHDNFFDLGGHSLLAMQCVTESAKQGIHFTIRDLFRNQTVAELALVATEREIQNPEPSLADGDEIPITPIQHWFFELDFRNPSLWNASILFHAPQSMRIDLLQEATSSLLERHDALHLQFRKVNEEWIQYIEAEDCDGIFQAFDLSAYPEDKQLHELSRITSEIHASFKFGQGRLARFAFFTLGQRGNRLFIAAHHLVCDGISLQILGEELEEIYSEIVSSRPGENGKALPAAASFIAWARHLNSVTVREQALSEQSYWSPQKAVEIPVDFSAGVNTMGITEPLSLVMPKYESAALVTLAQRQYRSSIDAILVWAMASTIMNWIKRPFLSIHMVGHGREASWSGADLSRMIGWLNVHYPLFLELPLDFDDAHAVAHVANTLELVPKHGLGYGILRYLHNGRSLSQKVAVAQYPEVGFNYLGNFDIAFKKNAMFSMARESTGNSRDPESRRPRKLTLFCYIVEGQIHADWLFSANLYRSETISALACVFQQKLRHLFAA